MSRENDTLDRISPVFNDEDADFLIVASDNVAFKTHKWLLSRGSGFFKDMLSLKQPAPPHLSQVVPIPVVHVSEESWIFEAVLRFIYPLLAPKISNISDLSTIIDAAVKYDIWPAIEALKALMVTQQFLTMDPLRLFAIGARYDFEELRTPLFRAAITKPILERPDLGTLQEFSHIWALDLQKLIHSQSMRAKECHRVFFAVDDPTEGHPLLTPCSLCSRRGCSWWPSFRRDSLDLMASQPTGDVLTSGFLFEKLLGRIQESSLQSSPPPCPRQYTEFLRAQQDKFFIRLKSKLDALPYEFEQEISFEVQKSTYNESLPHASNNIQSPKFSAFSTSTLNEEESDFEVRTSDGVAFRLNRWIMRTASPLFRDSVSRTAQISYSEAERDIVDLDIDPSTFSAMLKLIYPIERPHIASLEQLNAVLRASMQYGTDFITQQLRKELVAEIHLAREPFRVYAMATRYNFQEEADIAFKRSILLPLETDLSLFQYPEMSYLLAADYAKLLTYRQAIKIRAREVVQSFQSTDGSLRYCTLCHQFGCSWWKPFRARVMEKLWKTPSSSVLFDKSLASECLEEGCPLRKDNFRGSLGALEILRCEIDELIS